MLMMMAMACLRVWERCGFHYICEGNHKQHLSAAVQWKEPQEQHFLSISLKIDRLFKKSKHMKNHRWMNNWHISFDKTQRQRDICLYMRIKRWNNSFHVSVNCCVCGGGLRDYVACCQTRIKAERWVTGSARRLHETNDWNISTWWLFWSITLEKEREIGIRSVESIRLIN